jgi:putative spermidine/putrescine transport system substrate-binding protein
MTFRKILYFFGLIFALTINQAFAKDTLRILAWPGYADRDWVVQFEKQTNSKVEVTIADTDDVFWQKLTKNNGQDFDVFAANTAELQRYIDVGIAAPLDLEKIPNTKNQLPRFQQLMKTPGIMRDNKIYAVPFTYSEMGLIYDRNQIKTPPTSMSEIWNPKYKGKVLLYDGTIHNFSFTALVLGMKNPFKLSEGESTQVFDKLIALRSNQPRFYLSPEEGTKIFTEDKMALMFGNFGAQQVKSLQDAGADIGYIIPNEGALAWLDTWIITSTTKHRDLAEQWINFAISSSISWELSKRQGLANTLVNAELNAKDKIFWLEPVENVDERAIMWSRVRMGNERLRTK